MPLPDLDLTPFHIEEHDTVELVEKLNNAMDATADQVNLGLKAVGDNAENIATVAGIASDVTAVAGISPAVETVAAGSADVEIVADNIEDIQAVTANMSIIQAAPSAAVSAALSSGQASAYAAAAAQSKAEAEATVVSGDVSFDPAAGQVPIAGGNGRINPAWVPKALEPSQWIENLGTTGAPIPDDSEAKFTAQMTTAFCVFVPAVMASEIALVTDGVQGIYITTDKKIRMNCYGVHETVQQLTVADDWIDLLVARDDDETGVVTLVYVVNGVPFDTVQVGAYSDLYLRDFLDGEEGFSFIASQGHTTLTSAGLLKTQVAGDPIGLMRDLGPNGLNGSQGTAAARPLLGRVPACDTIRNQLLNTEDLESSYWSTKDNISTRKIVQPDGLVVHELRDTADGSEVAHVIGRGSVFPLNTSNTRRFLAKKGTRSRIEISGANTGAYNRGVQVDLDSGAFIGSIGGNNLTITSSEEFPDFWEISYWGSDSSESASRAFFIRLLGDDNSRVYTGDGTGTVYIAQLYSERGQSNTGPYQRVGATARDVTAPGVPDAWYTYFDGSDDVLTWTVPAITGGTIILAGTHGIWIDELTVDAGTFSIGPSTYTSGPAGLLSIIGDAIGGLVIGRPLTELERTQIIARFKDLGAPGVFEISETEMVTNGTFDSDLTGWALAGGSGGTIAWESGKMRVTRTSTNTGGVQSVGSLSAGEFVYLRGNCEHVHGNSADARLSLNRSSTVTADAVVTAQFYIDSAEGPFEAVATVLTTGEHFVQCVESGATGAYDFDNVSVRRITLNTGA